MHSMSRTTSSCYTEKLLTCMSGLQPYQECSRLMLQLD